MARKQGVEFCWQAIPGPKTRNVGDPSYLMNALNKPSKMLPLSIRRLKRNSKQAHHICGTMIHTRAARLRYLIPVSKPCCMRILSDRKDESILLENTPR